MIGDDITHYEIQIIRKAEQKTSNWSGGTTTELAIYPKHASYAKRNFVWRLSSAIVNTEESIFTSLPGFWRLIMIIEGEMLLKHEGHHDIYLKPFEQDSFSGGWITRSYGGKVRDFNLMIAEGYNGELKAIEIGMEKGYEDSIGLNEYGEVKRFFYCAKGSISFYIGDKISEDLYEGDLLLINSSKQTNIETIRINAIEGKSACIICGSISNCGLKVIG